MGEEEKEMNRKMSYALNQLEKELSTIVEDVLYGHTHDSGGFAVIDVNVVRMSVEAMRDITRSMRETTRERG